MSIFINNHRLCSDDNGIQKDAIADSNTCYILLFTSTRLFIYDSQKVFGILMVILIAVIYVLNNNEVKEAVESIVEYTYEGISNLITGNHTGHGLTNSTDMRIDNRDQALNMIAQFDILEYMLGKGFMTFWFDMPLLQSYLDMGVIGFLLFFSYTVILPFYAVFSKTRKMI